MKITDANRFVNRATTFLNNINAHSTEIEKYGVNLMPLASSLGLRGIRIVTDRHFILKNTYHGSRLEWSSIPYRMVIKRKPNGHIRVLMTPPHQRVKLERPIQQELRSCFYILLLVSIVTHWRDSSHLMMNQIRFLMRLNGIKFNTSYSIKICNRLNDLKKQLKTKPSTLVVQNIYKQAAKLLTNIDFAKGTALINLVKISSVNSPNHYVPLIISKLKYLQDLGHLPIDKQSHIQKSKNTNALLPIPIHDYIETNKDYSWSVLDAKVVIGFIDNLIFYLQ